VAALALALPLMATVAVAPAAAAPARRTETEAQGVRRWRPAGLGSRSPIMEACRVLRLNLLAGAGPNLPPLVVIAPAAERAGGLVAAGLAIALAEEGCRTLLVDADLRAPLLHTLFGLPRDPGLAGALIAGDVTQPAGVEVIERLRLLPAGTADAPLAGQPALPRVIAGLARQHDAVIYHIAARRASADALQLATHVGAAVFCVRAGIDTAEPIRRMRETLRRAGAQVLGFAMLGGSA
jgi:non-specific protein-tyrosine kinase